MSKRKASEEEETPISSEEDNESTISSSPKTPVEGHTTQKNNKSFESINETGIVEVYKDNFIQEMKTITSLLSRYNYIGMDTEFPGTLYPISSYSEDFYYNSLKLNVDSLKLIQLGITLSNSKGEHPYPYHTWQFNCEFDYSKDKYDKSSLNLLISSGIDFNKIKKNGINHKDLMEQFKVAGLVLNPNIKWISFHGGYDFAYLLKNLLENSLPKNEKEFTKILGLYFPNHYDIRILVKNKNYLKGSLNKLAQNLSVERKGTIHQAGSDSLVTIDIFWKLIKNGLITQQELVQGKNIIYGILRGKDNNETIKYIKINNSQNNNNNISKNNINNLNYLKNSVNNKYTLYPIRNDMYNVNMNYYCPQVMINGFYNLNGLNNIQIMNRNNFIQFY